MDCNADLGSPCDSDNGEPCQSCKDSEAYWRNEWERTGRREYEREQSYVQNMIDAGRGHLLTPEQRYEGLL